MITLRINKMIGKHKTELYLEVTNLIKCGKSTKEIRMTTGVPDSYQSRIRKSLRINHDR